MDNMDCEDMIYDEAYTDFMFNYMEVFEGAERVYGEGCINEISEDIAIIHTQVRGDPLNNLAAVPYSFIPKLFGLMDSSNLEVTGVKQVQNPNTTGLTGKNVIIGFVDTGIDYTNPLFKGRDGRSRIGVLWDQTIRGMQEGEGIPSTYYGTAFSREQIDEALKNEDPYSVVPSRDSDGHGTFMAGVAAGGADPERDFLGIAPEAELAVVKLKQTKSYLRSYFGVPQDVPAYQETDLIYALDYLFRYAEQKKRPLSVFIGLGSSSGGHAGLTFLERYINTIRENVGRTVSVPAGNEGNERLHYSGDMLQFVDIEEVELNVAEGQDVLAIEFWGDAPTTFSVGLISPQGDQIERISPRFGEEELVWLPVARSTVYVAYQLSEAYSGDEFIFIRIVKPTPGIWRILVYGGEGKQRTYNMWLPIRQFLRPETYFLKPDPENTITNPGNAELATTMTAYNHLNGSIYAGAGRGGILGLRTKPVLTAPGVNITGPGLRGNLIRGTGTSVAAAHSAGMMALFLQWNIENYNLGVFYPSQIRNLFIKSAIRAPNMEYPNLTWGYGIMNINEVLEQFRVTGVPPGLRLQDGEITV